MKKVLTIIGIIGVLMLLVYIFIPKEKLKDGNVPFINSNSDPKETNSDPKKTNSDPKETGNDEMAFVSVTNQVNYENGYFYIRKISDGNKIRMNIMYFDYDTRKEVYLCNKPNCNHNSNSCSSYLKFSEMNELFYYNNYLYLINTQVSSNVISVNADGTVNDDLEGSPTTVYRMNLDGTNKTKLFSVPSGTQMAMPYIVNGNILYAFLEEYKTENTTSIITSRKLIAVHLDTGKYDFIIDGTNKSFIGGYQDKIVLKEIEYKNDPSKFENDDQEYFNNLYHSNVKIKLLDLSDKKEKVIYEDIYKNLEILDIYKNRIYFIGQGSKSLEYLDLDTMKKALLKELSEIGATFSVIDDKILIHYNKSGKAEYIDLKTNDTMNFTLKDNNDKFIKILSSNKDSYFVMIEEVYGDEYTTWAGTKNRRLLETNYALVKKEDYWASRTNYIKMISAK